MIWLFLRFGISAARICSLNAQIGVNAINAAVAANDINGSLALNAINLLLRCPR